MRSARFRDSLHVTRALRPSLLFVHAEGADRTVRKQTPFEFRCIGPETPEITEDWLQRWSLAKFPLLVDGERNIAETSIIIEYLQLAHPGPVRLLPTDPMAALDVRFLDRFFDLHVMTPVQHAVGAAMTR